MDSVIASRYTYFASDDVYVTLGIYRILAYSNIYFSGFKIEVAFGILYNDAFVLGRKVQGGIAYPEVFVCMNCT